MPSSLFLWTLAFLGIAVFALALGSNDTSWLANMTASAAPYFIPSVLAVTLVPLSMLKDPALFCVKAPPRNVAIVISIAMGSIMALLLQVKPITAATLGPSGHAIATVCYFVVGLTFYPVIHLLLTKVAPRIVAHMKGAEQ